MVDAPDLERAVFIRVLDDTGEFIIPGTEIRYELQKGDIRVLRWSAVKELVQRGQAELI
jgi:GINS complex subunit 4